MQTMLGIKQGQTQIFNSKGERVPVTNVQAGPCFVSQVKTAKVDSYFAIQLGLGTKKVNRITKPLQGHIKKSGLKTIPFFLREVRVEEVDADQIKPGDEIKVVDIFKTGDKVDVTGVSKGKGFAGVVKRWGFKGGPATHGQSDRQRAPGSIGATTTPGRVLKGKKMAGRMGGDRVTVRNLEVIEVDGEKNALMLKGSVPGPKKGLLIIKKK